MPAFYAHDRFGADVSNQVPQDLSAIISEYYAQFEIGLQGPDIFFFHRPYIKSKIAAYGVELHKKTAYSFFKHARKVVEYYGKNSKEYAYILGFICHYALDTECHPYVSEMMDKYHVAHLEIEEEFEKMLMREDGLNPFSFPLQDLVPTDDATVDAIYPFFRVTKPGIAQSLKDLKGLKKLFVAPGASKQAFINTTMKAMHIYDEMKGLMNQHKDNLDCLESNEGLLDHYRNAIPVALDLIENFDLCIGSSAELSERFNRNFE